MFSQVFCQSSINLRLQTNTQIGDQNYLSLVNWYVSCIATFNVFKIANKNKIIRLV